MIVSGASAAAAVHVGLSRSLASTCATVLVSSSASTSSASSPLTEEDGSTSSQSLSASILNLAGLYEEQPTVVGGRPVFQEVEDDNLMYWTEGLAAENNRRRLREEFTGVIDPGGGGDRKSKPHRMHSGGTSHGNGDAGAGSEWFGPTAECDTGGWVVGSANGSFPLLKVFDCARHPADVTSENWYVITCRDCEGEPLDSSFSMTCSGAGDDDVPTVSPTPISLPFTNSPAVEILDTFPTIAPGATVVIGSEQESFCETMEVENSGFDGEYTVTEIEEDGRFVYELSTGAELQWISVFSRRQRRSLSKPESDEGDGGLGANKFTLSAASPSEGSHIRGRRMEKADGGGEKKAVPLPSLAGARAAAHAGEESLAACTTGAWLLVGPSGTYPVRVAYDCAIHPADVNSFWYDIDSMYSSPEPRADQVTIRCPDDDSESAWSSSSPGVREANQQGSSLGEDVADRSDRSGGSSVSSGLAISGVILVGAIGILACCAGLACHMKKKRDESEERRLGQGVATATQGVATATEEGAPAADIRHDVGRTKATSAPRAVSSSSSPFFSSYEGTPVVVIGTAVAAAAGVPVAQSVEGDGGVATATQGVATATEEGAPAADIRHNAGHTEATSAPRAISSSSSSPLFSSSEGIHVVDTGAAVAAAAGEPVAPADEGDGGAATATQGVATATEEGAPAADIRHDAGHTEATSAPRAVSSSSSSSSSPFSSPFSSSSSEGAPVAVTGTAVAAAAGEPVATAVEGDEGAAPAGASGDAAVQDQKVEEEEEGGAGIVSGGVAVSDEKSS